MGPQVMENTGDTGIYWKTVLFHASTGKYWCFAIFLSVVNCIKMSFRHNVGVPQNGSFWKIDVPVRKMLNVVNI